MFQRFATRIRTNAQRVRTELSVMEVSSQTVCQFAAFGFVTGAGVRLGFALREEPSAQSKYDSPSETRYRQERKAGQVVECGIFVALVLPVALCGWPLLVAVPVVVAPFAAVYYGALGLFSLQHRMNDEKREEREEKGGGDYYVRTTVKKD